MAHFVIRKMLSPARARVAGVILAMLAGRWVREQCAYKGCTLQAPNILVAGADRLFSESLHTQGLETFSSPQTASAAASLSSDAQTLLHRGTSSRSGETRGGQSTVSGCLWTSVP